MDGMEGMDMGGDDTGGHTHNHQPASVNSGLNHALARNYWYIAAAIVGFLLLVRAINTLEARQRHKGYQNAKPQSVEHPTRPHSLLTQFWATATAIIREMGHPQFYVSIRGLQWTTPPPLGRIIVLVSYCAVVAFMMAWQAVEHDIYYFERIAYRNAWIALTQLPMLYLLAMKVNPIGWIVGLSHERINWLHRWVGRVMFVTATVHGFYFWTQWAEAEFTEFALQIMPLTKYGFGAWGILLWNILTGFVPLRSLAYEFWLVQHVVGSLLMLWLLYKHIPITARYNLWLSIACLVFDRLARWFLLIWQNLNIKPNRSTCQGGKVLGHHVSLRAVGASTTLLTVKNVHFAWDAGQFVYLWIPRIGPVEAHPYTIACARRPHSGDGCYCNSIQFIVRAHGGFSKRLYNYAQRNPDKNVTGFLSGPFGAPPKWDAFETVVLIGASTGASFTVPFLEDMATRKTPTCVKRVEVVLLAKSAQELDYYIQRTKDAAQVVRRKSVSVTMHVAITGGQRAVPETATRQGFSPIPINEKDLRSSSASEDEDLSRPTNIESSIPSQTKIEGGTCCMSKPSATSESASLMDFNITNTTNGYNLGTAATAAPLITREYTARPELEALIREPVEKAWGETAVVVCGGREVVANVRNAVARLSDERAVHKGTGAQGIYLHVEEYSF